MITAKQQEQVYDLMVIGGGINGVGIALNAAERGLKVVLCEMNDLASATSSHSSKLIHGGLRYLEYREFRLVREALTERELLLKKAPHIIWPLRFRLPHRPHLRPAWMIYCGLFLYDHLNKRSTLEGSRRIQFDSEGPLKKEIKQGFEYSDCWVDDARLVIINAMAAREKGAHILTQSRCVKAQRNKGVWEITVQNQVTGKQQRHKSKALVNAAGPWVSRLFDEALVVCSSPRRTRLVKGSHIIVPRIHDDPQAYILQIEDKRIVFVSPYEEKFSLIGTTDVEYHGNPADAEICDEELDYLISSTNQYFKRQLSRDDVITSYAGVRALPDEGTGRPQAISRDYLFELDHVDGKAPLLSVYGGKITTYRRLSEAALNHLVKFFPQAGPSGVATEPLPGGDFDNPKTLQHQLYKHYPWMPATMARRFVRSYGTRCHKFLAEAQSLADLGYHFGAGLHERELQYLIDQEWAISLEDVIWRRSKLGLFLSPVQQREIDHYLQSQSNNSQTASSLELE